MIVFDPSMSDADGERIRMPAVVKVKNAGSLYGRDDPVYCGRAEAAAVSVSKALSSPRTRIGSH